MGFGFVREVDEYGRLLLHLYVVLYWRFCFYFFVFFVQAYFAYFKVDEILECLGESKVVSFRRSFMGSDIFSRAFFVNTIAGMLVFPEIHIKDGGFTRDEFENIPRLLKSQLRALVFVSFFLGSSLLILWGVGEYTGWLK